MAPVLEIAPSGLFARIPAFVPVDLGGNAQANTDSTLLSGTFTVNTNTADLGNGSYRGVNVFTNVSAIGGTPNLVVTIQGKDVASGQYYTVLAGAAITGVSTQLLQVYPALTAAANAVANAHLPATWRVLLTITGTTPSLTLTVGASLLI